jgi:hypothetical protein
LYKAGSDAVLKIWVRPVGGVVHLLAASYENVVRQRDEEGDPSSVKQAQEWQSVFKVHEQSVLACNHQITFHMELSIHVLAYRQVSALLGPGHVRDVVVQVEDDHVVARQLAERLLHLDDQLFNRGLVGPPAAGGADDDFVAPVGHGIALLDGMAATNEQVPPGGGLVLSTNHPVMNCGCT